MFSLHLIVKQFSLLFHVLLLQLATPDCKGGGLFLYFVSGAVSAHQPHMIGLETRSRGLVRKLKHRGDAEVAVLANVRGGLTVRHLIGSACHQFIHTLRTVS